jgi:hypothetical protein
VLRVDCFIALAAAITLGGGCRCGNGGDTDGGGAGTDGAPATDAAPGTDAAAPASDSALPPPQCIVGLISDDATANLSPIFALLDAMPDVGWDHMPDNANALFTENAALVGGYDVVVWYERDRLITAAEAATMEAYLQGGGRLLVTGHDSLGDPDDPMLAALVRSSTVGDLVGPIMFSITDGAHPIATGPFGTHATAELFATPTNDIDMAEADLAAGAVTVAEYAPGYDKIIATELPSGGIVVYWNGNGQDSMYVSPDWAPGQDGMREMLQNAVAWLCTP